MRRVVANWVFRSEEQLWEHAVVVLCDDYVGHYYKIEDDDMPPTEWLGGIIFLSTEEEVKFPETVTVEELKKLLLDSEYTPRYAYHLTGVDPFSQERFPSSRVERLVDDGDY